MAQEKYYRLKHFVPDGCPQIHPGSSSEVKEMMPYLIERVSREWTTVPNHDGLEVFAPLKGEVPCLAFRKRGKEAYLHIFCNEFINPIYSMGMVVNIYAKFNLGKPAFIPEEQNWIHTIPIPGTSLSQGETLLTHQLTQSLFWTIYMDFKRRKGI